MKQPDFTEKIVPLDLAKVIRAGWRDDGARVVFTNGVFDLLHRGHVRYLADARNFGDRLIIGLNSDASARALGKGPGRPINDQQARGEILAALEAVDMVVTFEDETPLALISALEPDVLVKGGDYRIDEIVGATEVQAKGGEVKVIPFLEGYSTTDIEKRIRSSE